MIFWNVLVSRRICHYRAIQPFDLQVAAVRSHQFCTDEEGLGGGEGQMLTVKALISTAADDIPKYF